MAAFFIEYRVLQASIYRTKKNLIFVSQFISLLFVCEIVAACFLITAISYDKLEFN